MRVRRKLSSLRAWSGGVIEKVSIGDAVSRQDAVVAHQVSE
jgi:hypothetical protein